MNSRENKTNYISLKIKSVNSNKKYSFL